jgi:hypothetical protein
MSARVSTPGVETRTWRDPRPRRDIGDQIRDHLRCPFCSPTGMGAILAQQPSLVPDIGSGGVSGSVACATASNPTALPGGLMAGSSGGLSSMMNEVGVKVIRTVG